MNFSTAVIVAGYVTLVWQFGGWGVLAAAAHVAVLMACIPRR